MKSTVFIASSSRDVGVLEALQERLDERVTVRKWVEGREEMGRNILDWAISEMKQCDFGLFVLSPDDRHGHQANPNVLLELGLFIGSRGPEYGFVLKEKKLDLPNDLKGRILAEYDAEEFKDNGSAALDDACRIILGAIQRREQTFMDEVRGLWLEEKAVGEMEGPYSLVEFDVKAGLPKVRGRSYDRKGKEHINWPDRLSEYWIPPRQNHLYHMFDATYGETDRESALGVSVFKFDPDRRTGKGYYVVHGSGRMQGGVITFSLRKITKEYLKELQLDLLSPALDDNGSCAALIEELLSRARRR
jgi:hypothetical protein